MTLRRYGGLLLVLAGVGCSGNVQPAADNTASDAKLPHADAQADDGGLDATVLDAFDGYADPGCPDAPLPGIAYACDPLAPPPGDCLPGEACYPYVDYPFEPCGAETYGASCYTAGAGTQGDDCLAPYDCASGFVCAISGSGTMCVRICSLTDPTACPDGQLCEPLDTPGLGGCL